MPIQEPGTLEPEAMEPLRAPEVTQEPQNLVTDEGEPVTFTCRIRGSPGKYEYDFTFHVIPEEIISA